MVLPLLALGALASTAGGIGGAVAGQRNALQVSDQIHPEELYYSNTSPGMSYALDQQAQLRALGDALNDRQAMYLNPQMPGDSRQALLKALGGIDAREAAYQKLASGYGDSMAAQEAGLAEEQLRAQLASQAGSARGTIGMALAQQQNQDAGATAASQIARARALGRIQERLAANQSLDQLLGLRGQLGSQLGGLDAQQQQLFLAAAQNQIQQQRANDLARLQLYALGEDQAKMGLAGSQAAAQAKMNAKIGDLTNKYNTDIANKQAIINGVSGAAKGIMSAGMGQFNLPTGQ